MINNPCIKFNQTAVEARMNNFIPLQIMVVITYAWPILRLTM